MEQKELLRPFNKCLPIIFVIGWGWTYLGTKYLSIKDGMMNKSFFALGSCGVVLMTSALFLYAFNHEAVCTGVQPGHAAEKADNPQLLPDEILVVDGGDLQLATGGRLYRRRRIYRIEFYPVYTG